jgi:hypothetical protein
MPGPPGFPGRTACQPSGQPFAAKGPSPLWRRPLVVSGVSRPAQQLRQLGDVGGDAPKRAHVCAKESSHRPRANQGGWLGASSKVMVFVGAPLASLAGTMSTRTRS